MLESIKQELLKAKQNIESLKNQEIANQVVLATSKFIEPKFQEFETSRNEQIANTQKDYQVKIEGINSSIDMQKKAFNDNVVNEVSEKVSQNFNDTLAKINEMLGE